MSPWLHQSGVILRAGREIQGVFVAPHSRCVCRGLDAGDLHRVYTITDIPVGLPSLPCSGLPATMGGAEHPWPSSEEKSGALPLRVSAPHPCFPFPLCLSARAVPGSCEPTPGLISVESMPALLPCIDLINEELPMVFSTLLSVKITF